MSCSCCSFSVAEQSCPENQVYWHCGTSCPLTCANKDNPPLSCNKICVSGCFCISGYYQAADGSCVTEEGCSSSQGACTSLGWSEFLYKIVLVGRSCNRRTEFQFLKRTHKRTCTHTNTHIHTHTQACTHTRTHTHTNAHTHTHKCTHTHTHKCTHTHTHTQLDLSVL